MRVVIVYRPNSEFSRMTEEYAANLTSRYGIEPEIMNIDTREGSAFATTYDIVQYPSILVLMDDGSVQKTWEGANFPLIDEVASYANPR